MHDYPDRTPLNEAPIDPNLALAIPLLTLLDAWEDAWWEAYLAQKAEAAWWERFMNYCHTGK